MNPEVEDVIDLIQIAYKSEWALAKFFDAIFNDPEMQKRFRLSSICGRETTKEEALGALMMGAKERLQIMKNNPRWRGEQRLTETQNLLELMIQLNRGTLDYHHVNGNQSLPVRAYAPFKNRVGAMLIHSKNTAHLGYIRDGIENLIHLLCEKPLVPVLDERGNPDRGELEELEKLVGDAGVVLMDAEHYSYKRAAITFYENLDNILEGESGERVRIKAIRGEIAEFDDPKFKRTMDILSLNNKTGLMSDTMCHLLAFISNLQGKPAPVERNYELYQGYNVDTFDDVTFSITGENFTQDARANFRTVKFIHLLNDQEKWRYRDENGEVQESKHIIFGLDDGSEVVIDFKKGSVVKKSKTGISSEYSPRSIVSSNEYINILNHFHDCLTAGKKPRTNFGNSITTLNSIFEAYSLGPEVNQRREVYN